MEMVAVDWPQVLEVAKHNAQRLGVVEQIFVRFPGAGSRWISERDTISCCCPNFLHHFSAEVNEGPAEESSRGFESRRRER